MRLPENVNDALLTMSKERGSTITATDVVNTARNPRSVLHTCFEWKDSVAGEKYRIHQARNLIRLVRVEIRTSTTVLYAPRLIRDPEVPRNVQGYRDVMGAKKKQQDRMLAYEISRAIAHVNRVCTFGLSLGREAEVVIQLLDALQRDTPTSPQHDRDAGKVVSIPSTDTEGDSATV